jgi:hypothetical protein
VAKVLADDAARAAAEELVAGAEADTRELVGSHRPALAALAAALVERDELSGDEVRAVLAEHGVVSSRAPLASGASVGPGTPGARAAAVNPGR